MKIQLNQSDILNKFSATSRPILMGEKLDFVPHDGKQYIVFDSNRKSPVGFGVRVGATTKTYIVQRKIDGKVIKAKVGNVSDFANIDQAREAAQKLTETMKQTGRNPNVINREKSAAEITLGEAFETYREHLSSRAVPAKPNTFIVFDKSVRKFNAWKAIRVRDLTSAMILGRFDEIAKNTRTTAEQAFRWANACVNYVIEIEEMDAQCANRQPTLSYNPFIVLKAKERYRSNQQLEESYKVKGVRTPLSAKDTLGQFLDAVWLKRSENRTGCDYFILMTLWGTRQTEILSAKWRNQLSEMESQTNSWVCLETKQVFLYDTKNRSNHTLPICAAAMEILTQRMEANREKETPSLWVFPARSKFSKSGHYSDSNSLLKYVCLGAKIKQISHHDLRRTFGRIAEELVTYSVVKRLLNHQATADVSTRYTDVEEDRLRESLQRIELHILSTAPTVYNALLTPTYPPIQAKHD